MSATPVHLTAQAIEALLRPVATTVAATSPPAVNAATALARLDLEQQRACGGRTGAPDALACPAFAGRALDGM
jgi:hypothetical protein